MDSLPPTGPQAAMSSHGGHGGAGHGRQPGGDGGDGRGGGERQHGGRRRTTRLPFSRPQPQGRAWQILPDTAPQKEFEDCYRRPLEDVFSDAVFGRRAVPQAVARYLQELTALDQQGNPALVMHPLGRRVAVASAMHWHW